MYKNLPSELITTIDLTQEIEGNNFYHYLTFTVFGEVLKVENDFDNLPDSAKQLIIGSKNHKVIAEQQFRIDEFKYIIPLVAIGGFGALPDWMDPIETTIQQLQKNIPSSIKANPKNYISSSWIIGLIEKIRTNGSIGLISTHFKRVLLKNNIRLNIQLLHNEEIELATPILIDILEKNWDDEELAAAAIRGLARIKNDEAFQLLRKIFNEENLSVQTWIIARKALQRMDKMRLRELTYDGLSNSNTKKKMFSIECMIHFLEENEVVEILTNLYKYDSDISIKIKAIEALSYKKNNPNFIELLALELDTGSNEKIRYAAVKALKRINTEKSEAVLKKYFY